MRCKIMIKGIIIKNGVFIIVSVLTIFLINSCDLTTTVDGDLKLEHDITRTGMITGKVTVATVENNTIVWTPFEGAIVQIEGTDFSTSSLQGGIYAIDQIPTGSYNVSASIPPGNYDYSSDIKSAIVEAQKTTTVPDHQLEPSMYKQILHGKIYREDGVTPFGNQTVYVCRPQYNTTTKQYSPGEHLGTTVTNTDGSYAFYGSSGNKMLSTSGYTIWFMDPDSPILGGGIYSGIVQRDARIK